jgi:hypothetical protein
MELIKEELHKCGKRVFCNVVVEGLTGCSFFNRFSTFWRRILAFFILFFLFEILELVILVSIKESIQPIFISTLFAAVAASLSFSMVSWCYQYTVDSILDSVKKSKIGGNLEKGLVDWFKKHVTLWKQILVSIGSMVLVVIYFYAGQKFGYFFNCSVYAWAVTLSCATFGVAQGGYLSLKFPLMTRELEQVDISEVVNNPLCPRRTPFLIATSKMFTAYAVLDAFIITWCLAGLLPLGYSVYSNNFLYPLIVIVAGYIVTSWTFFYPQLNIKKVIKKSKENTLLQIESKTNRLYEKIDKLENADLERLKFLKELHKNVSGGSNTMISFCIFKLFITYLLPLIPVLPMLITYFLKQ